jgi:RsbT co-antagonist protein rsbRD N-terminal domain
LNVSPQKRQAIAERWLGVTIATYPGLSADFLRQEKDPFRNPVGAALKEGIPLLVAELCGGMDAGTIAQALEGIVRMRALQAFSPAKAVGFVFELREIVRNELSSSAAPQDELQKRIDDIALAAFEVFMRCREQVYEVRLHETRRAESVLGRMQSRDQGG